MRRSDIDKETPDLRSEVAPASYNQVKAMHSSQCLLPVPLEFVKSAVEETCLTTSPRSRFDIRRTLQQLNMSDSSAQEERDKLTLSKKKT